MYNWVLGAVGDGPSAPPLAGVVHASALPHALDRALDPNVVRTRQGTRVPNLTMSVHR